MTVRTRFAPSPTGRLHLGNVRAAVFNWLFARHRGGAFVLRIEDTDTARNVEGSEAWILEDLRWLGLDWDEGPDVGGPHEPYRQSGRGEVYAEALARMLESGTAYPCFCEEEVTSDDGARRYSGACRRLDPSERARRVGEGEPHAVRLAVPEGVDEVQIEDEVFGSIVFPGNDLDDFVLRRRDGRVTYNFGVVADDAEMEITHVIRGVGHLSNTPKQALIYDALGLARPVFAHLPTVLAPDGGKLSKRRGATPVAELRAQGYPADAVLNYLSLLGWSHPEQREVLERAELVEAVSLDRVGKSDTRFDPEKLRWIAGQHLAREGLDSLCAHVEPFVERDRYPLAAERLAPALETIRTRMSTYGDVNEHLALLYPEETEGLAARRRALGADPEVRTLLEATRRALEALEPWDAPALESSVRETGKSVGAKGAGLFHPLREALIGSESGPELGKILAALGRREALRRLGVCVGE